MAALKREICGWCTELGFQQAGVSDVDLALAESRLGEWLQARFHGSMHYMEKHGTRRSRPAELVPGTVRVISVRMDYLTADQDSSKALLDHPSRAYVSRYALGRDYHKVMRARLRDLARGGPSFDERCRVAFFGFLGGLGTKGGTRRQRP